MSAQHTPKVLEIIRTAAQDCRALGNTCAANELLDAAAMTSDLLEALMALDEIQSGPHPRESEVIAAWALVKPAIAKATGSAR